MKKPVRQTKTAYDYHEITDYVKKKHNLTTEGYDENNQYYDLWHYLLDKSYNNISNGCYVYMYNPHEDDNNVHPKIIEFWDKLVEEFPDFNYDYETVWVNW